MSRNRNESSAAPLVEEGAAFMRSMGLGVSAAAASRATEPREAAAPVPERVDVVVIGAGQAGLSVGYHLARHGLPFVILDANARIGDAWRKRWDSLRLFTPARFDGLDGMPFPAPALSFPTKDEMADYLEAYATQLRAAGPHRRPRRPALPRAATATSSSAGDRQFEADHVVVAMATYQRPAGAGVRAASSIPASCSSIRASTGTRRSCKPGGVLIVGAGNSGAEIALDASQATTGRGSSGRDTGHVPFRIDGPVARLFLVPLVLRVRLPPRADGEHADRAQGPRIRALEGRTAHPDQADGA